MVHFVAQSVVAYLMKESIDDSVKFERYHLLNQTYSKIYNYTRNIKPAPNPYYLLDKFTVIWVFRNTASLKPDTCYWLSINLWPVYALNCTKTTTNSLIACMEILMVLKQIVRKPLNQYTRLKKSTDKHTGPSKSAIIKDHLGLCKIDLFFLLNVN
jgi:hypothetical protein